MKSQKWIRFLALALVVFFAAAGLSEGFVHHHHNKTEESDCAYCSFHQVVNNSDFSPAPPVHLISLFLLSFVLLAFLPFYVGEQFSFHSGRAPPAVLS